MTNEKSELDSLQPFKEEVLLQIVDPNEVQGDDSQIVLPFETNKDKNQFYRVIKTGNEVEEVQEGDIVWLPWASAMIPFEIDTPEGRQKFTITKEEKIDLVIE